MGPSLRVDAVPAGGPAVFGLPEPGASPVVELVGVTKRYPGTPPVVAPVYVVVVAFFATAKPFDELDAL